eukprot:TRINITY_DN3394_c0_g1_i2.p1 TRINITY_DN3394_c0_g1~~TRINITY_DN3394_c0_g1_i2.p1  ORF type:complete len:356 (-),score=44.77 TRINITY_DN3394_c0_g1_i2:132-1070(-)
MDVILSYQNEKRKARKYCLRSCSQGNLFANGVKQYYGLDSNSNEIEAYETLMECISIDEKCERIETNYAYHLLAIILMKNGKDKQKMEEYLLKAIELGNHQSMHTLGLLYHQSKIGNNLYKKAVEYYEMARKHGNHHSIYNLGIMYLQGKGVVKDFLKAKTYFEEASKLGNSFAMLKLSNMYESGVGIPSDSKQYYFYLEQSANHENSNAMFSLARLIEQKQCNRAAVLFANAHALGNPFALGFLEILINLNNVEWHSSYHFAWKSEKLKFNITFQLENLKTEIHTQDKFIFTNFLKTIHLFFKKQLFILFE